MDEPAFSPAGQKVEGKECSKTDVLLESSKLLQRGSTLFSNPLALLALLALPAILGIHLYRRKAKRLLVSSVFLWGGTGKQPAEGRRRSPLASSLPLWLELAAAACTALAIAQPRGCVEGDAPHLVIAVDSSISMNAMEGAPAAKAASEAAEMIRGLPRGARVSLLASGSPPSVLAGPGAEPAEALAMLESFRPSKAGHSLQPVLDLALGLSGGSHVALLTDGPPPEGLHPGVEWISYGSGGPNASIIEATRGERELKIMLAVYGGAGSGLLIVEEEGRRIAAERWDLGEAEKLGLGFSLAQGTGSVEISIEPDGADGLEEDNKIFLLQPETRELRLAGDLSEETAQALGLVSGGSRIGAWLRIVGNAVESLPHEADLLITDGEEAGGVETWRMKLLQPGREDGIVTTGPYWTDLGHPLLEGVAIGAPAWRYSQELRPRGTPLVQHREAALLTEQVFATGKRLYQLQMDPFGSNLAQSPPWPILLSNLAELRRDSLPGARRTNLRLGEDFSYAEAASGRAVLEGKEQRTLNHPGGTLVVEAPSLGRSRLLIGGVEQEFSVNLLDPGESDLGGRSSGRRKAEKEMQARAPRQGSMSSMLCIAALLLLGVHWKATEEP
jgi:Ca-activated chloride channel homolog